LTKTEKNKEDLSENCYKNQQADGKNLQGSAYRLAPFSLFFPNIYSVAPATLLLRKRGINVIEWFWPALHDLQKVKVFNQHWRIHCLLVFAGF
jgi:hypothetical protein